MRAVGPFDQPIRVTAIDDELVFIGEGRVAFSMTPAAARLTLHNLAAALLTFPPGNSGGKASLVILVVEDEPLVREVAAAILEDAGYIVIVAEDPKAALDALEGEAEIDLLFTDVQMPGDLNGIQLARLVKDRWPSIQLLVTSGQVIPESLPSGGRFLPKPYAAADILRQVGELTAA